MSGLRVGWKGREGGDGASPAAMSCKGAPRMGWVGWMDGWMDGRMGGQAGRAVGMGCRAAAAPGAARLGVAKFIFDLFSPIFGCSRSCVSTRWVSLRPLVLAPGGTTGFELFGTVFQHPTQYPKVFFWG